jgi:lysozyme family protein
VALNNFQKSLQKVLLHEGGYVNHPKDPGGATNKGVTQKVYDDYRSGKGLKDRSVKNLEESELEEIYRVRYWSGIKGDSLPAGVSYVVFDGAVNSGVAQSVKWLQRALGVNPDGVVGPATLNAVKEWKNYDNLIDKICDRRLQFLKALKTWGTFGRGWAARVEQVRATGKAWADGDVSPEPTRLFDSDATAKGRLSDAKSSPPVAAGDAAAGIGGGGFGVGLLLDQAKDQLMPLSGTNTAIDKIISIVIIASLVIGAAGLAYRFYAAYKKKQRAEALNIETKQNA